MFGGMILWFTEDNGSNQVTGMVDLNKDAIDRIAQYDDIIKKAAHKFNVPESLIKGTIYVESRGNYKAISKRPAYEGGGLCGAVGLMQLMPLTAYKYGKDYGLTVLFEDSRDAKCNPAMARRLYDAIQGKSDEDIFRMDNRFDPEKNIYAGTNYLAYMLHTKYAGDPEAYAKTMIEYNSGISCKEKTVEECRASLTKQTSDYFDFVLDVISEYEGGILPISVAPPTYASYVNRIYETTGVYLVDPSFRTRVDFDFGVYKKAFEEFKKVEEVCGKFDKQKKFDDCVKQETEKLGGGLRWGVVGDGVSDEDKLIKFAKQYEQCLSSLDHFCYCDLDVPDGYEIYTEQEAQNEDGFYRFKLLKDGKVVYANNDYGVIHALCIYSNHKIEKVNNLRLSDNKVVVGNKNEEKDVDRLRMVKYIDDNYELLSCISVEKQKPLDLHECRKAPIRTALIKAKTGLSLYVSDGVNVKEEEVVINFAYDIPDEVGPSNELAINAIDEFRAEGSVMLSWRDSPDTDTIKYLVYYGKGSVSITEEQNPQLEVVVADIPEKNLYYDLSEDARPVKDKPNEFVVERVPGRADDISLEHNEPYYSFKDNRYHVIIDNLEDGVEYSFVVVPVDIWGNKNLVVEEGKNMIKIIPEDDLPPAAIDFSVASDGTVAWNVDLKNLKNDDGSELVDLQNVYVYESPKPFSYMDIPKMNKYRTPVSGKMYKASKGRYVAVVARDETDHVSRYINMILLKK